MFGVVFKTAFYVFVGTSWKKLNFLKKSTSYKNFVGAVKIGFYCPKKHLQAKNSFRKLFNSRNIFVNWTKKYSFSIEKILAELSEFQLLFLLDHVEGKYFFWKRLWIFYVFRTLSKDFSVFCQKKFVGLSKLHFTCPFDQFEEIEFFWRKEGLLITFGLRSTIFQHFVHSLSTGFSKMHSTCS